MFEVYVSNEKNSSVFVGITFRGKNLDPDEITNLLKINPRHSFKSGDLRKNSKSSTWPHGLWSMDSSSSGLPDDINLHFEWLLDRLEPVQNEMRQILEDEKLTAKIDCFWLHASKHINVEIGPRLLGRLANLNIGIWFDIYCSEDER